MEGRKREGEGEKKKEERKGEEEKKGRGTPPRILALNATVRTPFCVSGVPYVGTFRDAKSASKSLLFFATKISQTGKGETFSSRQKSVRYCQTGKG